MVIYEEDTPIHILGREHHLVFLSVARQVPADRLGCLLSLQNADGNTAVHELAHHDASLVFTELMTLMGTQSSMQIISIRNKQGATVLQIACALQRQNMVTAIVKAVGKTRALDSIQQDRTHSSTENSTFNNEIICDISESDERVLEQIRSNGAYVWPCVLPILGDSARPDLNNLVEHIADEHVEQFVQKISSLSTEQLKQGNLLFSSRFRG